MYFPRERCVQLVFIMGFFFLRVAMMRLQIYLLIPILVLILILTGCIIGKGDGSMFSNNVETGGSYNYTDKNAPKTIESKEITFFEVAFTTYDLNENHDRHIPYDPCQFNLVREGDGVQVSGNGGWGTGYFALYDFKFRADSSVLAELQAIIDKHELAKVNGINEGAIGIPGGLGSKLVVKYETGESISASDNRSAVINSAAALDIYDFFVNLARAENPKFIYSDDAFWDLHDKLWGHYETVDGKWALDFSDYQFDIYDQGEKLEYIAYYIQADKIYSRYTEDGSFYDFSHLEWREDKLFGILIDGGEVEFIYKSR